ncbi:MAG TPA: lytic transglycosylase domain-containing protein [Bryobacteraceae bacterium]|nr:lytic transglycosylase domain-containing protein [Bryobacteraceae bacterium]
MLWTLLLVLLETPPPAGNPLAVMDASLERQRSAIRRQVGESAGAFFILPPPAPLFPPARFADLANCPALSDQELQPLVAEPARTYGLKAEELAAVVRQKSGGRPCAVSPSGALGLVQLMPETLEVLGVADAFDPRQNLAAGARLLKQLLDTYHGDWGQALAAYDGKPVRAASPAAPTPVPPAAATPAPADKTR